MYPTLIKAKDPADLQDQIADAIAKRCDMHTPLFVSHEGLLCQWVVPSLCIYEYRLIVANDLDDLELQTSNLMDLNYEFLFSVALWQGKYLQWMSRMNNAGLLVKNAMVKLVNEEDLIPAPREDEFKLVEGVRSVMGMAPVTPGGYVVEIPFPVKFS